MSFFNNRNEYPSRAADQGTHIEIEQTEKRFYLERISLTQSRNKRKLEIINRKQIERSRTTPLQVAAKKSGQLFAAWIQSMICEVGNRKLQKNGL